MTAIVGIAISISDHVVEPDMAKILGISGSLRRGSFNAALLRAAAEVTPGGSELTIGSIREIPLYDGDVEAAGIPASVQSLKEQIMAADGLLLATPEYNNSMPGVFKNTIDWLSRPASDIPRVFTGRPVAIMGATPGRGGTILSQAAWLPVFRALGLLQWSGPRIYVMGASKVFDAQGTLVDEDVRKLVAGFMKGFAEFIDNRG
jgi:chromate reductase, NAD(P)H dehydrogenase (quinone)